MEDHCKVAHTMVIRSFDLEQYLADHMAAGMVADMVAGMAAVGAALVDHSFHNLGVVVPLDSMAVACLVG